MRKLVQTSTKYRTQKTSQNKKTVIEIIEKMHRKKALHFNLFTQAGYEIIKTKKYVRK